MTSDILNRANALKKTIDKLESEKTKISAFFEKKENLSAKEIDELINIAMINTSFSIRTLNEEFKNL
ncbi:hypothetical protein LNJ40_09700 [Tenacibaculum dicentrarchi]|nr:hypothetical protein [Tenacibaculum dicentrarchi]